MSLCEHERDGRLKIESVLSTLPHFGHCEKVTPQGVSRDSIEYHIYLNSTYRPPTQNNRFPFELTQEECPRIVITLTDYATFAKNQVEKKGLATRIFFLQ